MVHLYRRTAVRLTADFGYQFNFLVRLRVDASCWGNVALLIDIHNLQSMHVSVRYGEAKV